MVPHTHRSGCVALLDPFSLRETPVELCAEGEIRGARSHPRPQPSRILNPTTTNQVRRHTHFGGCIRFFLPPRNPIRRMHRQCTTKYRSAQPPKTPTLECPQPIRRRNEYGATHPLWRVFLTLRNPHPKNPRTRLGRNTGVCAATQDLNPRVSPTPTMTNQVRRHTPTSVLSPSTKPNPENAQTTHHETQECAATQDPDSRVPTTHTMAKQVRCHTPTSAIFSLRKTPIQRIHGKARKYRHACSHPRPNSRTIRNQYNEAASIRATHPKRVLSPSAQPHLKNATQDPNPEYQ
ncbi:hypothetical protein BS47DRAFT_1357276 [Hydnum rufescens UP504]|uniref:Uncharacterized protein n=1 Tax=Hydnum rufescens UP504 TaxID=1448309 RepID=A0A9P6BBS7_9AGAM|nr:hypothetical protein BS47DRAFT_1357276 [Hydnum rufescens UP504]